MKVPWLAGSPDGAERQRIHWDDEPEDQSQWDSSSFPRPELDRGKNESEFQMVLNFKVNCDKYLIFQVVQRKEPEVTLGRDTI